MKDLLILGVLAGAFVLGGFVEVPPDVVGGAAAARVRCDTTGLKDVTCVQDTCALTMKRCKTATGGIKQTELCDAGNGTPACNDGTPNCNASVNNDLTTGDCTKYTPKSDKDLPGGF